MALEANSSAGLQTSRVGVAAPAQLEQASATLYPAAGEAAPMAAFCYPFGATPVPWMQGVAAPPQPLVMAQSPSGPCFARQASPVLLGYMPVPQQCQVPLCAPQDVAGGKVPQPPMAVVAAAMASMPAATSTALPSGQLPLATLLPSAAQAGARAGAGRQSKPKSVGLQRRRGDAATGGGEATGCPAGRSRCGSDASTSRCGSGASSPGAAAVPPPALARRGDWTVVRGDVLARSRTPLGCREVQQAFEDAPHNEACEALALELQGNIWEVVLCPYGNYVVQKSVSVMRPHASQFIIDELRRVPGNVVKAARHKFGCRVLQRLLEYCRPDQVQDMVKELLEVALALSRHRYGNYVMQHVLLHGTPKQKESLSFVLRGSVSAAGSDVNACAVLSKALDYGSKEDEAALAEALIGVPGLLARMARTRYGHEAVKLALPRLSAEGLREARRQLFEEADRLRLTRYGRSVMASMEALIKGDSPPSRAATPVDLLDSHDDEEEESPWQATI